MMRFVRRVSLLAAFCLVAVATTASAECAWVLWSIPLAPAYEFDNPDKPEAKGRTVEGVTTIETSVVGAYPRREACLRARPERADTPGRLMADGWHHGRRIWANVNVTCLPDTVDPRGQKGH